MGAMMPVKFLKQPLHGSGGIWGADGAEDGEPKGDGGSRARSAEAASAAADTCFAAAVCAAFWCRLVVEEETPVLSRSARRATFFWNSQVEHHGIKGGSP